MWWYSPLQLCHLYYSRCWIEQRKNSFCQLLSNTTKGSYFARECRNKCGPKFYFFFWDQKSINFVFQSQVMDASAQDNFCVEKTGDVLNDDVWNNWIDGNTKDIQGKFRCIKSPLASKLYVSNKQLFSVKFKFTDRIIFLFLIQSWE